MVYSFITIFLNNYNKRKLNNNALNMLNYDINIWICMYDSWVEVRSSQTFYLIHTLVSKFNFHSLPNKLGLLGWYNS